jgi:hypothetical protein
MNPNIIFPDNEIVFETLCCDIAKEKFGDYHAQKFGRRGQAQGGIDIKAIDRNKQEQQHIVIQCKFRANPFLFQGAKAEGERTKVQTELLSELETALKVHQFHQFIYACCDAPDGPLQQFAEALSLEKGVEIVIWCKETIESDIKLYPRLTRLYTFTGEKSGVESIDHAFITQLQFQHTADAPDVFRFYSGNPMRHTQWHGILQGWDAPRTCMPEVKHRIEDLFNKPLVQNKVAAVIYGEGGCGKSTLLRRIAIDHVREGKPYNNWWIENLGVFMEVEKSSIDATPQQQHLLFIEDWYRTVGKDKQGKANEFFMWLGNKANVCVVIGDRKRSGAYAKHVYGESYFELAPSENSKILGHIAHALPHAAQVIQSLQQDEALCRSISLFEILFVMADMYEEITHTGKFDIRDIGNTFKELIAKRLVVLEDDVAYKGLGKALFLCAKVYANEAMNYFVFSENAFILVAAFLGENTTLKARIAANGNFPDQVSSLLSRESAITRDGSQYNYIRFNHDILAEKGIIFAETTKYEFKVELDPFTLGKLMRVLVDADEYGTALMLWLWNYQQQPGEEKKQVDALKELLKDADNKIRSNILLYILYALDKEKQAFAQYLLGRKDFLQLGHVTLHIFNVLKTDPTCLLVMKNALDQPGYYRSPSPLIPFILKLLGKDYYVKQKAREILEQPDFLELPESNVAAALKIWEETDFGKQKAREILTQKNLLQKNDYLASMSLRMLAGGDFGKQKAREILNTPRFYYLSQDLVMSALGILKRDTVGKQKAIETLEQSNFMYLNADLVSVALGICSKEPIGNERAADILKEPDFLRLPKEIVTTAIKILKEVALGREKAREVLAQPEFWNLTGDLVSTSLRIWEKEPYGKEKAKELLDQPLFYKFKPDIVAVALRIWEQDIYGKERALAVLQVPGFYKLPKDIVCAVLKCLATEAAGKAAAAHILSDWMQYETFIVFNAVKVLAASAEKTDREALQDFLSNNAQAVRGKTMPAEIMRLYYDLLYLPLLHFDMHRKRVHEVISSFTPTVKRAVKLNIYRILCCYSQYPGIRYFQHEVKELCLRILDNWRYDISSQLKGDTDELIDLHIQMALCHPGIRTRAKKTAAEIVATAKDPHGEQLQQLKLFETAKAMLEQDDFREWKV